MPSDLNRTLAPDGTPRLAGLAEVAEILGVTKRSASRYTRRPDFPEPLARLVRPARSGTRGHRGMGCRARPVPSRSPRKADELEVRETGPTRVRSDNKAALILDKKIASERVALGRRDPRTASQIGAIYRRFDAPGRIRTSDPRIRSPPLCPLSYGRVTVG